MECDILKVKTKVAEAIKLRLGGGEVFVELTDAQLFKCIDLALSKLKMRSDAFVEESLVLLSLQLNQKEYILPNEIVDISRIYRRGFGRGMGNLSGSSMDPFMFGIFASFYSVGALGANGAAGLTTYEATADYLKVAAKMFCSYPNYAFNPNTHKLILAENPRGEGEIVLLHSYVDRPDYMILQDRFSGLWCENWAYTEALKILSHMRGRFQSLGGPMGAINQNASDLKSECKEMQEELIKELERGQAGGDVAPMILSG